MSYIRKRKRNGKVYLEEVESKRIDGKVVQKHIRYVGREADGKTILSASISDLEIEQVKVHGCSPETDREKFPNRPPHLWLSHDAKSTGNNS
jgi:hypothetical protein